MLPLMPTFSAADEATGHEEPIELNKDEAAFVHELMERRRKEDELDPVQAALRKPIGNDGFHSRNLEANNLDHRLPLVIKKLERMIQLTKGKSLHTPGVARCMGGLRKMEFLLQGLLHELAPAEFPI